MPKLSYRGIIARPGTYKRKDGSSVTKTWEELKKAFQKTRELILTLGHPITPDGKPRLANIRDYIGRVLPIINEEKQVIEGDFLPHEEEWDKIPSNIQHMLESDLPLDISTGQTSRNYEGIEQDALYNHIALLVDGENPICPLGECGINVRVESDDGDEITMTYEQATSTKDEEKDEPVQEEKVTKPEAPPQPISFTPEQFETLMSTLKPKEPQPTEDAGAEPAEEEKSPPDKVEEPVEAPTRQPSLVPEKAFPAGSPTPTKSPHLKDDGSVEIPSDTMLGKKTKT